MVKRRGPKAKAKKRANRPTRRKTVRRKAAPKAADVSYLAAAKNQKAQWDVYRELQKKADEAWAKLRADVHKKADPAVLLQDRNHLMLLLGECNYMAGECMRMSRGRY